MDSIETYFITIGILMQIPLKKTDFQNRKIGVQENIVSIKMAINKMFSKLIKPFGLKRMIYKVN